MRYVAAYMLATLGGNQNPSAADVEKILSSVGIEVNSAQVQDLIAKLEGKNVDAVHFLNVERHLFNIHRLLLRVSASLLPCLLVVLPLPPPLLLLVLLLLLPLPRRPRRSRRRSLTRIWALVSSIKSTT